MSKSFARQALSTACWWLPALLFALFTVWSTQIDLAVARSFYSPNGFLHQADLHEVLFTSLYKYGNLPGQIAGVGAGLILLLSLRYPSLKSWRKGAWVIALTGFLGAALLINGLVKEFWNRPRPRQLVEFGGAEAYHPWYSRISNYDDIEFKSFPSGHAAMGFLFLAFGLVGWYERKPWLLVAGTVTGAGLGLLLSYGRLMQGGHFTSDVLASAVMMWYVALIACKVIYGKRSALR